MKTDFETRSILVLQNEARRMSEAAERVALIVKAMALRRGLPTSDASSAGEHSGLR